jgi:hypothetical protein
LMVIANRLERREAGDDETAGSAGDSGEPGKTNGRRPSAGLMGSPVTPRPADQFGATTPAIGDGPAISVPEANPGREQGHGRRSAGRPKGKPSDNEERDEWIYDEYVKGTKEKTILALLKEKFPAAYFGDKSAIPKAVERAAKRWRIPVPSHGQGVNHRLNRPA